MESPPGSNRTVEGDTGGKLTVTCSLHGLDGSVKTPPGPSGTVGATLEVSSQLLAPYSDSRWCPLLYFVEAPPGTVMGDTEGKLTVTCSLH